MFKGQRLRHKAAFYLPGPIRPEFRLSGIYEILQHGKPYVSAGESLGLVGTIIFGVGHGCWERDEDVRGVIGSVYG
jgi:hypothetical protein